MSLTDQIKSKLTPEQLIIAEKWEVERQAREDLVYQFEDGKISDQEFLDKMKETAPDCCEHGRSIWLDCLSCEDLERIIRPENFEDENLP